MSTDRRRFSRVNFVTEASLEVEGDRYPVQILNLSLKGCLLEMPSSSTWEIGSSALLRFQLVGSPVELCFHGSLIHRNGQHLGYRFERVELESMTHLRTLLEYNLGDPAQVEREVYLMVRD